MANGLLKKIAIGTAIAGSALFGSLESKAATVDWETLNQAVANANNYPEYGGEAVNYTTTITVNGVTPAQNMNIVYSMLVDGAYIPVGGFSVEAGSSTGTGWFNRSAGGWTGYGLEANQSVSDLNNFSVNVVYDYDGDKTYGQINDLTGYPVSYQAGEHLNNYDGFSISASGLPNFPSSNISQFGGLIEVIAPVPEPTVISLIALGAGALFCRRRKSK